MDATPKLFILLIVLYFLGAFDGCCSVRPKTPSVPIQPIPEKEID